MPQLLAVQDTQNEARGPLVTHGGHSDAVPRRRATPIAAPQRRPIAILHALLLAVIRPRSHPIPACADIAGQYESALDNICRIDPYLYIGTPSG